MSITLRQRMHQDLQLAGLAEATQRAYLRAVRQLAAHYQKAPDLITEQELREYLLGSSGDIIPTGSSGDTIPIS